MEECNASDHVQMKEKFKFYRTTLKKIQINSLQNRLKSKISPKHAFRNSKHFKGTNQSLIVRAVMRTLVLKVWMTSVLKRCRFSTDLVNPSLIQLQFKMSTLNVRSKLKFKGQ